MKPMLQIEYPCDSIQQIARASYLLAKTNYNYQATPPDDPNCRWTGDGKLSFHTLSHDYFTHEAHLHFAHEAVLFLVMMIMAAFSFLTTSGAVLELVRGGFQTGFPL